MFEFNSNGTGILYVDYLGKEGDKAILSHYYNEICQSVKNGAFVVLRYPDSEGTVFFIPVNYINPVDNIAQFVIGANGQTKMLNVYKSEAILLV